MRLIRSASFSADFDTAPPAITMPREAYAPVEYGVRAVSPSLTSMREKGIVRISLATCASAVSSGR